MEGTTELNTNKIHNYSCKVFVISTNEGESTDLTQSFIRKKIINHNPTPTEPNLFNFKTKFYQTQFTYEIHVIPYQENFSLSSNLFDSHFCIIIYHKLDLLKSIVQSVKNNAPHIRIIISGLTSTNSINDPEDFSHYCDENKLVSINFDLKNNIDVAKPFLYIADEVLGSISKINKIWTSIMAKISMLKYRQCFLQDQLDFVNELCQVVSDFVNNFGSFIDAFVEIRQITLGPLAQIRSIISLIPSQIHLSEVSNSVQLSFPFISDSSLSQKQKNIFLMFSLSLSSVTEKIENPQNRMIIPSLGLLAENVGEMDNIISSLPKDELNDTILKIKEIPHIIECLEIVRSSIQLINNAENIFVKEMLRLSNENRHNSEKQYYSISRDFTASPLISNFSLDEKSK